MFAFTREIRIAKQAEFDANKDQHGLPDAVNGERPPQLFVNEMLKMFDRGEIDMHTLDEELVTMIVGVSGGLIAWMLLILM